MPTTCAASECKNNSKKDSQVTFHRFPADPKRRAEWLKHLNRENFFPTLHTFLCSKHFEEACFDRTGQTVRLRSNAVPTIFIYPEHMKEKISCLKVTSIAKPEEPLPQSSTISQKPTDLNPDHNYCLPSPAAIKKKICELERKLEMAHKKIKIYQQRERRVKTKDTGENIDGSELKQTGKNSWDVF